MTYRDITPQLPFEILQEVFLFLAASFLRIQPLDSSGRPEWIAVTYVCRYWRSAALGVPKLWSSITPRLSVTWSHAMIQRSAPTPMRIDLRIGSCYKDGLESPTASELLFPSMGRIRTLRLSGYRNDILGVLDHLSTPSPLESLDLKLVPNWEQPMSVHLPENLFGKEAPYCRGLKFETPLAFRAPHWLLANITHFATISCGIELHDLLGMLQAMPQLEVLCITNVLKLWSPFQFGGVSQARPRAVLPHLSLLSICDKTSRHLPILTSHIDAPPTLRKRLFWCSGPLYGWDSLSSTFAAMQALIPRDSASGVDDGGLRVARVTGGWKRGSFEVWSRTGSECASTVAHENDALFLFNINWDRIRSDGARPSNPFFLLPTLCARLDATHVEHLIIAPETAISGTNTAGECATNAPDEPQIAAQWQALLTALPSVKVLHLHRGSPASLSVLQALSASADLLPHLQSVFVVQSIVRCATATQEDGTDDAQSGTTCAQTVPTRESKRRNLSIDLEDALKGRSELELVLVECEVDDEALNVLRKQVRVVRCDKWAYM